jgi:C-terminal processing protease CtpA/Prc
MSKDALLEDYDFLVEELKLYHQGLYQYVAKDIVDQKIDSIRNTIVSGDEIYLFKKVNALIALTNEGHTNTNLPSKILKRFGRSKSFIPIELMFSGKKAILMKYFLDDNLGVQFGDQILSINGKSIDAIMEALQPYVATDGFNETSLYEWVSWYFPLYYSLLYGKQKEFEIEVKSWNTNVVKKYTLQATSLTSTKDKFNTLQTKERPLGFAYKTIADSIGYLAIPDFYSLDDYEDFYKKCFTNIKKANVKHLIIDIQDNVGGEEGNENLLASYLYKKEFKKYENVLAPASVYEKFKKSKSAQLDQWELIDGIPHRGAFTLMSDYVSEFDYKAPNEDLKYHGKVYVLIAGRTFSGGAEFASMLKFSNRATFIGEETGGAYEGNVSGESIDVTLPNSKIEVSIPIVHFKMNIQPEIKGRGVMPDYEVPQRWDDIIEGKNSKLEFALRLIKEGKE